MIMLNFLFSTAHAQFSGTINETGSKTQSGVSEFFSSLVNKFPGWIAGAIVILMAFIIARIARSMVVNKVATHLDEENEAILILVGRTTYVGVLSIGLAIGLNFWGIQVDALLAAFGIGIAFALRDIMTNFISGVLILISGQFKIGDFIQVGSDTKGKVAEIQARATILKGLDGTKIIVPNKDIFNKQVISFTTNATRRIDVVVGVDYRTNLALASKIILHILNAHKKILREPHPAVVIDGFNASSIDLKVKYWVSSHAPWVEIKSEVFKEIHTAFQEAEITIPWPITTFVYDKDGPAGEGKEIPLPEPQYEDLKLPEDGTGAAMLAAQQQATEPVGETPVQAEAVTAAIPQTEIQPEVEPVAEVQSPAPSAESVVQTELPKTEVTPEVAEQAPANMQPATPQLAPEVATDAVTPPPTPQGDDSGANFLKQS